MKRVALVTGGARGIGLGISKCLAAEGFDLAVCGVREAAAVVEPLGQLRQLGAEVLYCRCDLADAAARDAMLAELRSRFGRLHVLVNNAGVAPKVRADLLEASEESFEYVLRTNLQGPYFLTQAVARWMVEQKKARGGVSRLDYQHLVGLRHGGLGQSRRLLHLEGGHQHGHPALGGAAGRVCHPRL